MKQSIVKYKSIIQENNNFRLDAEYYSPEYMFFLKQIKKYTVYYLRKILHPTEILRIYCDKGIQILLAQNVRNNELDFSNIVFMDNSCKNLLKKNKLEYNDVVITRSGANFGQSASFKTSKIIYACADVLVIKSANEIKGGYLSTFLNSKQGKALLNRGSYGMAQPHIAPSYLYTLPIPRFHPYIEEKIDQIVTKADNLKQDAINCYTQAEKMLLSELNLLNWKPKYQKSFVKNYSDTIATSRIDAEYFQPMYDEIVNRFNNYKCVNLNDICELIGHPSNPPYAQNEETNKTFIVTQKHLGRYFLNNDFCLKDDALYTTKKFIKQNKQYLLKNNDILVYSVGAYIGKANIYTTNLQATIGSFLTIVRLKENTINPYYLLLLLNTDLGIMMSKRYQRGLAQPYLYPYDIKKYIIPIIDDNIQKDIEKIMVQAKTKIDMSKNLLEIAKNGVEIAIEQDESTAEKWINSEVEKLELDIE